MGLRNGPPTFWPKEIEAIPLLSIHFIQWQQNANTLLVGVGTGAKEYTHFSYGSTHLTDLNFH